MSNFVQVTTLLLLFLILGAIFAFGINNNSYEDKRTVKIIEKLDEISKKLDAMDSKKPQYNIMHGFYAGAKAGEHPFRIIQVDKDGYLILSRERGK